MNDRSAIPGDRRTLELAGLAAPGRLLRPARLYATVIDGDGAAGPRRFLAELPDGAAVFALAAPRVCFFLEGAGASAAPQLAAGPLEATAIDTWFGALLGCIGLARSDAEAIPLEAGDSRSVVAGNRLTARNVVWLEASGPILRYAGPPTDLPAVSLLVMANQIGAEVTAAGDVKAMATASLLEWGSSGDAGVHAAPLAELIGQALVEGDLAEQRRWQEALALDHSQASLALQRLRDIASFRRPATVPAAALRGDALAGALSVIAAAEGFVLRPAPDNDRDAPLRTRLVSLANTNGFRFREITLGEAWWQEEGPAFLAVEEAAGRPLAMVWRGRRWHAVDPATLAETAIDREAAARLQPRGYMIYAALPERLTQWQLWRFSVFGVRGDVARLLGASAAATLAGLLLPVATGAILGVAVPDGHMTLLYNMLLLLGAAAVGGVGFQVVRAIALIRIGTHVDRRLQAALWDRVVRLRTAFFRDYSVGDLAQRILGIDAIRRVLSGVTVDGAISGVFSLASLAVMLIYDASLAAFAVGYAVVAALLLFVLGRAQMQLQRVVYQRKGIVTGLLVEMLGGIAKLRIAGAELRAFAHWSHAFAEQRANDARSGRLGACQTVAATSLPILGAIGIFAIAASGGHPVDVASFAAFNSAFGQFTAAILGLATALNVSIEAVPLFARVRPVLEAPLEVEQDRSDPGRLAGHLAMANLWFRYSENAPWILQDVSFEARPGETVAIVGASGSGKSTIMRLLLGFETSVRGGVYYDGRDLEKLDLRLVRRQIGTVLEAAGLVPGSLYENIAGSAPLSRVQVMAAVGQAGLEADVAEMPMGLETFVMEGGGQLSGGQRQRVMIARALVRKPRLIFLDEATSALDNHAQAIVGESLAALNATQIVIAHRLSTIRHADRILVLEAGRIVETGTYDELLARDGAFRRLAQRQLL